MNFSQIIKSVIKSEEENLGRAVAGGSSGVLIEWLLHFIYN